MEIFNRDSLCVMYWGGVYSLTLTWECIWRPVIEIRIIFLIHFSTLFLGGLVLLGFFCFFKLKLKLAIHFWLDWLTIEPLKDPPVFSHTHTLPQWQGYRNAPMQQGFTWSLKIWAKVFNHFQHFPRPQETFYCTCFDCSYLYMFLKAALWISIIRGYTASKKDKLVTPEFGSQRNWSSRLGLSIKGIWDPVHIHAK